MNKVTQDPYDMNEEDKVGSSIEGTKQTFICFILKQTERLKGKDHVF